MNSELTEIERKYLDSIVSGDECAELLCNLGYSPDHRELYHLVYQGTFDGRAIKILEKLRVYICLDITEASRDQQTY